MTEQSPGLAGAPGDGDWREPAQAWVDAQMRASGLRAAGPADAPRVRAWATVVRVPAEGDALYFKAVAPAFAHETALTARLSARFPGLTVPVLAADPDRGWLLMRDAGERLRGVLEADRDVGHWHRVLPPYARMQRALAPGAEELLAAGVPDRRLASLPARYRALLDDTAVLAVGQEGGLSAAEYDRLRALAPAVDARCAALAAYGIPETLQHDDLHDGNVLVRGGEHRIFDWGDSSVSHPFFTLLVTLRSAAHTLGLTADDPALGRLRDAYLAAWSPDLSDAALRAAFALASPLAMLSRALTWHRVVTGVAAGAEHRSSVSGWLQEFLDAQTRSVAT